MENRESGATLNFKLKEELNMNSKKFVCDECGCPLELASERDDENNITTFIVIPCEVCLQREYEAGCSDGEDTGYKLGYTDGQENTEGQESSGG